MSQKEGKKIIQTNKGLGPFADPLNENGVRGVICLTRASGDLENAALSVHLGNAAVGCAC